METIKELINELNTNSTIVALISSVVTGIIIGIISYCGVKKSTEATLKISSENINFQKRMFDENTLDKKVSNRNRNLFSIYKCILCIERNYNMTSMYMESDISIDKNNEKYLIMREELDKVRVFCDLYFYNELSETMDNINSSINIYWGYLDFYFRHKSLGATESASKCQQKAYNETQKIQFELSNIKQKIRNLIV